MKFLPAFLAAFISSADVASASRVKLRKFARFGRAGSILAKRATNLEVANESAGSAEMLDFEHWPLQKRLTEMSAWPSVYPGFRAKFPTAGQAVDAFKTANAALNKAKESSLPSSPTMKDRIQNCEGLSAAAKACHKAAEGAENAVQAVLPDLQQAVETAQKARDTKQAAADLANAQGTKGRLARVTLLNPWSRAAAVAKSAKMEAEAAAKAADDAEEEVRRLNNWVFFLDTVAKKSQAAAEKTEADLHRFRGLESVGF